MSAYKKLTLRYRVDIDKVDNPFTAIGSSAEMSKWRHSGVRFEFAFYEKDILLNAARMVSISLLRLRVFASTRTGSALMDKDGIEADGDITEAEWIAGTARHIAFEFTAAESALAVISGATKTEYWLLLTGVTSDDTTDPDILGGSKFFSYRDYDDDAGVAQSGNIVPSNATYNGSGNYTLTVEVDRVYTWELGSSNDTSADNDGEAITEDGQAFTAITTTVTLIGDANEPVTAIVRRNPFITSEVGDARYARKDLLLADNGVWIKCSDLLYRKLVIVLDADSGIWHLDIESQTGTASPT